MLYEEEEELLMGEKKMSTLCSSGSQTCQVWERLRSGRRSKETLETPDRSRSLMCIGCLCRTWITKNRATNS